MNTLRTKRLKILLHAKQLGYSLHRVNDWNYVLKRTTEKNGQETINIYWNSRNYYFTFMSAMDHPTKGKKQLTRKYIDTANVLQLLDNPRKHTGKGYYKKAK